MSIVTDYNTATATYQLATGIPAEARDGMEGLIGDAIHFRAQALLGSIVPSEAARLERSTKHTAESFRRQISNRLEGAALRACPRRTRAYWRG